MTPHVLEHESALSGRTSETARRFPLSRRRAVADWGADDVFHAPDGHAGRDARPRFADRWHAQHPAPAERDLVDDWFAVPGRDAAPVQAFEAPGATTADELVVYVDDAAGTYDRDLAHTRDGSDVVPAAPDARDRALSARSLVTARNRAVAARNLAADWDAPVARARDRDAETAAADRDLPGVRVGTDEGPALVVTTSGDGPAAEPRGRRRRDTEDWLADAVAELAAGRDAAAAAKADGSADAGADQVAAYAAAYADDPYASEPPAAEGRRTVVVRGRPESFAPVRASGFDHRSALGLDHRLGARPDRIAAWAVALGFLLILIAVSTADAATRVIGG